jgi:hypothetical protein
MSTNHKNGRFTFYLLEMAVGCSPLLSVELNSRGCMCLVADGRI